MKGILLNNLINAKINEEPYKHTTFQLFDKDLNDKLIKNFYEVQKHLHTKSGLSSSRFMLEIKGDTKNGINFEKYSFLKKIEPLNSVLTLYSNNIISEHYKKIL